MTSAACPPHSFDFIISLPHHHHSSSSFFNHHARRRDHHPPSTVKPPQTTLFSKLVDTTNQANSKQHNSKQKNHHPSSISFPFYFRFYNQTLTHTPISIMSLQVPSEYGWVVVTATVLPYVVGMVMGGSVMEARTRLEVPYPNLYAVPGVHKHADEFNRIQRGHQNYIETLSPYIAMTLAGGLVHPYACSIGAVFHAAGSILYAKGYSDVKLKVDTARHLKGGPIKYIGVLTSLISTFQLAYYLVVKH